MVQAATTAIVISWYGAGRLPGADLSFGLLAAASLIPLVGLRKSGYEIQWRYLSPAVLMAAFLLLAVNNPSHMERMDEGGWLPNPDWRPWLPTTMHPTATFHLGSLLVATLIQAGALAAVKIPRRYSRRLWAVLVVNAVALSLFGATLKFSGSPQFMGIIETKLHYFFSTFTYRNHWAAYALLMMSVAGGLSLSNWRRAQIDPRLQDRARFFAVAAILISFTPLLPGSRSGMILVVMLSIALLVTFVVLKYRSRSSTRNTSLVFALVALLTLITVGMMAWPSMEHRFRSEGRDVATGMDLRNNLRIDLTVDTIAMAQERPWFGWGLGSYKWVFPQFQGDYLRDEDGTITALVDKAHNEWAQSWAELGVIGSLIVLLPGILIGFVNWRRADTAGKWGLIGVGMVAGYAFVDFPLRNLAIAHHFVVILVTVPRR